MALIGCHFHYLLTTRTPPVECLRCVAWSVGREKRRRHNKWRATQLCSDNTYLPETLRIGTNEAVKQAFLIRSMILLYRFKIQYKSLTFPFLMFKKYRAPPTAQRMILSVTCLGIESGGGVTWLLAVEPGGTSSKVYVLDLAPAPAYYQRGLTQLYWGRLQGNCPSQTVFYFASSPSPSIVTSLKSVSTVEKSVARPLVNAFLSQQCSWYFWGVKKGV